MSITQITTGFTQESFDIFLETRNEPEWVTTLRREAFETFSKLQQEPLDPEEWKRLSAKMRLFKPDKFGIQTKSETATSQPFETLMQDRAKFAGHVTHVDGHVESQSFHESLAAKGILFGDLADLVNDHRELLEPHLQKRLNQPQTDRFAAWHAAFWTGGTLLYVPRNVEIAEPLYSLIALANSGAADLSSTLVILEEGATAILLEETASLTNNLPGLHVGAVELLLGDEASLQYVQLQNWNEKTWHFSHQNGSVASNARLRWTVGGLGSQLAHIHQNVSLDGRGAEAQVNGITFATNRQTISYYTKQSHNAPNTNSDLLYKEVLRDQSRVIWRGMIRVEPEAQQTDGYQRSDALMLSPDCRNDAVPGLEIEADDVRCTHAATAGQVDEEQVFYLMCRGLTRYEAMHMIVEGFFHLVYDRIPIELVRETLSHAVEKKLGIGD
ncbi:Iron-sulfur cluster assembly protein SufD [hydrothermal vent metagenome]|uniref:Iron-sulfur cluster assembly protein SufD n=1 Tax=hydrothermal vent metagenome TaxID=652676 RepID=A0A3B1DMQ4_9ZZZZ